jgi:hypothetical protein
MEVKMRIRCEFALLDTDQEVLFCTKSNGHCSKLLHDKECPLVPQKIEKSFEIGQRVRIIGPTKYGYEVHIGKCFVIGDKELHGEYSTPGCHHAWPATSLELAPPVLDSIDFLHAIEKRLRELEGKAKEGTSAQECEEFDYKLYGVICKKPGSGVYELAKVLGWSSDKVYRSIRHLARDGWIMAVRDGRSALKIMPVKWSDFLTPEEIEEFKKGGSA